MPKRTSTFIIILITLFAFAAESYAVFEGRDEKLQEYTGVRNSVTIEPFNPEQKAASLSPGDYNDGRTADTSIGNYNTPISDSPWFIVLFGGLTCASYMFIKKRK